MTGTATVLVLTEGAEAEARRLCEDLLKQSRACCVLLVGRDGSLLDKYGFTEALNLQAAAALTSAAYSSVEALAELAGEPDMGMFYQQGTNRHLQIHRLGDSALMLVVFDERTNAGLVRLRAEAVADQLSRLLAAPRPTPSDQDFIADAADTQ